MRPISVARWMNKIFTYCLMEHGLTDTYEALSPEAHGFRKTFQAGDILILTQQVAQKMTDKETILNMWYGTSDTKTAPDS